MTATARIQTPPGRGGIAVIALTGPDREALLAEIFRPLASHADAPADAVQLGKLLDPDGQTLDEAVIARSLTGAIEINIHGGPAVARAALSRLADLGAEIAPAQPAAPESFHLAHPKWSNPTIGQEMLDLLPAAASEWVVEVISRQWSAGLSALASDPNAPAADLRAAAASFETTAKLLSPLHVVLVGPPNVGKSTLANALVGRTVSIVHHTPGTTRDWVREQALIRGVPIWLTDTAGLFEFPDDPHGIEAESVRRARHQAERADLILLVSAGEEPTPTPDWLHAKRILRIAAKVDQATPPGDFDATVSAETNQGLNPFGDLILQTLGLADLDPAAPAAFTQRQANLLAAAANALNDGNESRAQQHLQALLHGSPDQ